MGKVDIYNKNKRKVLHMLSGGRDSFLSACLLIEQGYEVQMVTFDNGHMDSIERVEQVVDWIFERYPNENIKYLKPMKTAMTLHCYMCSEWYRKAKDRIKNYPELQTYQVHCLTCKTAMYVHAIAYCKAHGIKYISEGARKQQGFFVELSEMQERYERLCQKNGIQLLWPVYELDSDLKRKRQLLDRGLSTKTLEPQCYLGCPLKGALSNEERRDLAKYFDIELMPLLMDDINDLTQSKRYSPILKEISTDTAITSSKVLEFESIIP